MSLPAFKCDAELMKVVMCRTPAEVGAHEHVGELFWIQNVMFASKKQLFSMQNVMVPFNKQVKKQMFVARSAIKPRNLARNRALPQVCCFLGRSKLLWGSPQSASVSHRI